MSDGAKQERLPNGNSSQERDTPSTSRAGSQNAADAAATTRPAPKPRLLPQNSSTDASPHTSRNTSPVRKEPRPPLNPSFSTQPSAAAIQRALSAASVPQLPVSAAGQDTVSRLPRAHKSASASADTTPTWPASPRLKSPPPSASKSLAASTMSQPAKAASGAADSQPNTSPPPKQNVEDTGRRSDSQHLQTPSKSVSRGPSGKSVLETVQENSTDTIAPSPAAAQAALDLKPLSRITEDGTPTSSKRDTSDLDKPVESGSESAGNKSDGKRGRESSLDPSASSQKPKSTSKTGYGTLSSVKSRQGEGKQGMTVETETVPSIPQSALNPGDRGRNENSGSLRLKPSSETIRPKKDRRKPVQKPRSITSGTASSKADIFEARVASAVDAEAHSSDSDDTFVYESNPPERQRTRRHHSRTPSVTSSHSTAEPRGVMRNFGEALDDRKVAGKRSMKFSSHNDVDSPDGKTGTVRSHRMRRAREDRDGSQTTAPEQDSPFTQASKLRNSTTQARSRPHSPRSPPRAQGQNPLGLFGRKTERSFDFDGEGADDERTPLMSSGIRSPRGPGTRRAHGVGGIESLDDGYRPQERRVRWRGVVRGCCLGLVVCVCAVMFAIALLVFWNRPIYDVSIKRIENVLATESELIMDLRVVAINPNALSVTVPDMDLNVFAKSKHVGKSHDEALVSTSELVRVRKGGVDHGTDPPGHGDLEPDAQTMLLGRVFQFDQALTFENSIWNRAHSSATGELSLSKPGNRTEVGGSKRWERVLQYPFELIVRGTLKYKLPISTKVQSVAVEGSVIVHPEDGIDHMGNMRLEPVNHDEHWQWIDWPLDESDG